MIEEQKIVTNNFWIKVVVAIFCLIVTYQSFAVEKVKNIKSNLKKVETSINVLNTDLQKDLKKQKALQAFLRTSEINLSKVNVTYNAAKKSLNENQILLSNLHQEGYRYHQKLLKIQKALSTDLRVMYQFRDISYLKLLLSQNDVQKFRRMYIYYRHIESYYLKIIDSLDDVLAKIKQNQKELQSTEENLKNSLLATNQEKQKLEKAKHSRNVILLEIKRNIKNKKSELAILQNQKKSLEAVLKKLLAEEAQKPTLLKEKKPAFSKSTKLSWPFAGKIDQLFGQKIYGSDILWDGDLIEGPLGQKVQAIEAGIVVYSDWLEGYGFLTIIDHQNGYMSLYGRNSVLYKKQGDLVAKGEVIAEVGQSGGFAKTALYFSIRQKGKAIDPKILCN